MRRSAALGGALLASVVVASGAAAWQVWRPAEPQRERHVVMPSGDVLLPHRVEVPDVGDSGCPGHSFASPGAPLHAPVGTGAGATEAAVPLGDDAYLLVVCLGPVGSVGTVEEFLSQGPTDDGTDLGTQVGALVDVTSAYGSATRRTLLIGSSLVSDHMVEHDGWVHAVGYLRPQELGDRHLPVVEAVLASWEWDGD